MGLSARGRAMATVARMAAGIGGTEEVVEPEETSARSMLQAAMHHGLGPALHLSVRTGGLPPEVEAQLAGAYHRAVHTHLRALDGMHLLDSVLGDSLEWLVVKGPVLAERLYPRPDLRSYVDLDVVVRPGDLGSALRMLEKSGASLVDRNWRRLVDERPGELRLELGSGLLVDLHWHLLSRDPLRRAFDLDTDAVIDRSTVVDVAGIRVRTLDPVDTALHLGLHSCLSGGDRLIWMVDLHRAVQALPDVDALVEAADQASAELPMATMLRRARRALGAGASDDVLRTLAGREMWPQLVRALDAVAPLERSGGGRSWRRIVTRATRASTATSLRELGRRSGRLISASMHGPVERPSIRRDEGGEEGRALYLHEVVRADAAPQTAAGC